MRILLLTIFSAFSLSSLAKAQSDLEGSLSLGWDSHYFLEGRDLLDDDGLWSYTVDAAYKNAAIGFWQAEGEGTDYSELNLWFEYTFELSDLEVALRYVHLWFESDDAEDDEIGVSLTYNGLPGGIVPNVDWYHSFEADGDYIAFSVQRPFEFNLGRSSLTLTPIAQIGLNSGYIAEGHSGFDTTSLGLEASLPLRKNIALQAYITQHWAIDSEVESFGDDEFLLDSFNGGVSLSITF